MVGEGERDGRRFGREEWKGKEGGLRTENFKGMRIVMDGKG